MEANRQNARQAISPLGAAWEIVENWDNDELSAEAKLGWLRVYFGAGMKFTTVMCHQSAVVRGAGDPNRSGKRVLQALAKQGLITLDPNNPTRRGQWTFVLNDPAQVKKEQIARFCEQSTEHQGEFFEEPEISTVEEAATIPISPIQIGGSGTTGAFSKVSEGNYDASKTRLNVRGRGIDLGERSSGTTAADLDWRDSPQERRERAEINAAIAAAKGETTGLPHAVGPEPVGLYVAGIAQSIQLAREARPKEAARIAAKIMHTVEDPRLYRSKVDQIAWAVVEDRYPERYLDGVLRSLKEARADWAKKSEPDTPERRGRYFNACMERSFHEVGLRYKDLRPIVKPGEEHERPEASPSDDGEV